MQLISLTIMGISKNSWIDKEVDNSTFIITVVIVLYFLYQTGLAIGKFIKMIINKIKEYLKGYWFYLFLVGMFIGVLVAYTQDKV